MAEISMRNIVKRYGDGYPAVNDVSLDIADGEFMILVGPSGCGKSTLLRAVAGLEPLTEGSVHLDGADLADTPTHRRGFAMMFQDGQLFHHLDVAGNVGYALRRKGVRGAPLVAEVERLLALVDLAGYARRRPATLSGGEQQRVQFARALAQILDAPERAFMLLDEPTASLDIAHQAQLLRAARRLADLGTGVFVVLHDLNLAAAHADAVAILSRGRVAAFGAPDDVLTAETVGKVYDWPVTRFVPPGAARPVIIPSA